MTYRRLEPCELPEALELVWKVFLAFEAPDYSEEGVAEFEKSIHDPKYLEMLRCYGAFDNEDIVGIIATRSNGSHIALFFVDEQYQKQGIGRQLFELVLRDDSGGTITVHSSPFAVPVYRRLGFVDTDTEQETNGIRYTPMKLEKQRHE